MNYYVKALFFFLILFWISGILVEFLIPEFNVLTITYPYLKIMYSSVCHQHIEKTIVWNGHHLLVCSRCFGIYSGSLISSLIFLFIPIFKIKKISYLIIGAVPMFIDVLFYSIGIYNYSKEIAFFSGFLFGIVGIIYIYNGLQILLSKNEKI